MQTSALSPQCDPLGSPKLSEKGGLEGASPPRSLFLAGLGHSRGRDRPELGCARGRAPRTPCFSDSFLARLCPFWEAHSGALYSYLASRSDLFVCRLLRVMSK